MSDQHSDHDQGKGPGFQLKPKRDCHREHAFQDIAEPGCNCALPSEHAARVAPPGCAAAQFMQILSGSPAHQIISNCDTTQGIREQNHEEGRKHHYVSRITILMCSPARSTWLVHLPVKLMGVLAIILEKRSVYRTRPPCWISNFT